ncbi:MAG: hypothetical protein MUO63_02490, partial [Desulfobulbaceae bacterium]|nr:hypothetical protein [Desulfobulbaceae bacterium]
KTTAGGFGCVTVLIKIRGSSTDHFSCYSQQIFRGAKTMKQKNITTNRVFSRKKPHAAPSVLRRGFSGYLPVLWSLPVLAIFSKRCTTSEDLETGRKRISPLLVKLICWFGDICHLA